jgi:3-oxoacyl-[acyl-carrier-protein] synthase-1
MSAQAIRECVNGNKAVVPAATPLLLCLAEIDRPGRSVPDDQTFFTELEDDLGARFHEQSRIISRGHVSVAEAIHHARTLLTDSKIQHVLVAGVDTLMSAMTLRHLEERHRLLTSVNSDGFIPGDAGAAFLLERAGASQAAQLVCRGVGFGVEEAHIDSEKPLRADALTTAIQAALHDAECSESALKFKIVDAAGSQYYFKEASVAFSRIDRTKRTEFDIWHPADCVGEVGAAIGPIMIGVLKAAFEKGYAKGDDVLMHVGNDDGKRAALIFGWRA